MNAMTHEKATAQTAFGCFRIERRMPRGRRSRDALRVERRPRGPARAACARSRRPRRGWRARRRRGRRRSGRARARARSRQASRAARPRGSAEMQPWPVASLDVGDAADPAALVERVHELRHGRLRHAADPGELAEPHRPEVAQHAERAPDGRRFGAAGDGRREPRDAVVHRDEVAEDRGEVCWRGHRTILYSLPIYVQRRLFVLGAAHRERRMPVAQAEPLGILRWRPEPSGRRLRIGGHPVAAPMKEHIMTTEHAAAVSISAADGITLQRSPAGYRARTTASQGRAPRGPPIDRQGLGYTGGIDGCRGRTPGSRPPADRQGLRLRRTPRRRSGPGHVGCPPAARRQGRIHGSQ